jgi:hypothetical protein
MASISRPGKQTVDLARTGPRVSRIRRDPPPQPPRKVTPGELRSREARIIVIGLVTFGLAIAVLLFQFGRWAGWSPADYRIVVTERY